MRNSNRVRISRIPGHVEYMEALSRTIDDMPDAELVSFDAENSEMEMIAKLSIPEKPIQKWQSSGKRKMPRPR